MVQPACWMTLRYQAGFSEKVSGQPAAFSESLSLPTSTERQTQSTQIFTQADMQRASAQQVAAAP